MDVSQITVAGFSAIVLVIAIVEMVKLAFPALESRFAPLVALGAGIAVMVGNALSVHFGGFTHDVVTAAFQGLALGATAVLGHTIWSAAKTYTNTNSSNTTTSSGEAPIHITYSAADVPDAGG